MPVLRTILIHPKTCIPAILFFYPTLTKTLTVQDRHHCFFFRSTERPPNFNRDVNYIHVLALRLVCTEKIRLFRVPSPFFPVCTDLKAYKDTAGEGSSSSAVTVRMQHGEACGAPWSSVWVWVASVPGQGVADPAHLRGLAAGLSGLSHALYCRWDTKPLPVSTHVLHPSLSLRPPLLPFLFFLSLLLTISLHSHQLSGISVPIGWWTVHFFLIV